MTLRDPGRKGQEEASQVNLERSQDGLAQTMDEYHPADGPVPAADSSVGHRASRRSKQIRSSRWRPFHTGVIFGALVAVAVTLLIIQNGHSVRINWVAFHFGAPEWIVLFVTAAAGAVVWELIRFGFRRRGGRKTKSAQADEPSKVGGPPV